jgi:hypothetical protein
MSISTGTFGKTQKKRREAKKWDVEDRKIVSAGTFDKTPKRTTMVKKRYLSGYASGRTSVMYSAGTFDRTPEQHREATIANKKRDEEERKFWKDHRKFVLIAVGQSKNSI